MKATAKVSWNWFWLIETSIEPLALAKPAKVTLPERKRSKPGATVEVPSVWVRELVFSDMIAVTLNDSPML